MESSLSLFFVSRIPLPFHHDCIGAELKIQSFTCCQCRSNHDSGFVILTEPECQLIPFISRKSPFHQQRLSQSHFIQELKTFSRQKLHYILMMREDCQLPIFV